MKIEEALGLVEEVRNCSLPWDDAHWEALGIVIDYVKNKLPEKDKTCDWSQNYKFIGLTKEHIKRLNNAINLLESLNEHTDAKYLKEIKDKLLEVKEAKEADLEKEIGMFTTKQLLKKRNYSTGVFHITQADINNIAKHFFEVGLKTQKGE